MTVHGADAAEADGVGIALHVAQASKTFGHQRVLDGVDLDIAAGEIRALVGENGSGKSTMVKILAGYHLSDPGTVIAVNGTVIQPHRAGESDDAGLRFVHQDLALVPGLTTVENLGLGRGYAARRGLPVRWARQRTEAQAALAALGYDLDVDLPVAALQASERTAVAVARAMSRHRSEPSVLVLDEPTANLPGPEVHQLFDLVRRVRDGGTAVLFVSHHLNEVFELADTVSVLRGGALVDTRPVGTVDESSLIEMMVGRPVARVQTRPAVAGRPTVILASRLGGRSVVDVDIAVGAGEVVGVAGITGSGREEVAALLFDSPSRRGVVTLDRTELPSGRPDLSVAAGMALVPADRAKNALVPGLDLAENMVMARWTDFSRRGTVRRRLETAEASRWVAHLDIRPALPRLPISSLSGGNAQKVVLARWLRVKPRVLVLDEPTQGVDVGAKEDIHRRVEEAAEDGCAVIVCSSDSEELARLCTRVIVLNRGRVSRELVSPFHPDEITAAALAAPKGMS